jgi:hypothetical protein
VFSSGVPAENDLRRGSDRERPASANERTVDAGRPDEAAVDLGRVLDDVREACRRIRDAWRDAWR